MKDMAEDLTHRLMVDAGVREGMRVLDIGCGRGDLAFLAARLVGEHGQVLGIDREEAPIEVGRARARELGLANVSFARVDLGSLTSGHGLFDAVIGRRVLMYQPDAVACLSRLAGALVPGGLIVLQERRLDVDADLPAGDVSPRTGQWLDMGDGGARGRRCPYGPTPRAGAGPGRVLGRACARRGDRADVGPVPYHCYDRSRDAGTYRRDRSDGRRNRSRYARRPAGGRTTRGERHLCREMVFGAWARKAH